MNPQITLIQSFNEQAPGSVEIQWRQTWVSYLALPAVSPLKIKETSSLIYFKQPNTYLFYFSS